MVNVCAACTKTLRSATPQIKCVKCASYYHTMCVNISDSRKNNDDFKSNWLCPMCQSKEPKKDNSNTPVRAAAPSTGADASVAPTLRDGSRTLLTPTFASPSTPIILAEPDNNIIPLTNEIKLLREDISNIKSNIETVAELLKKCVARLDDQESRIRILEQRENKVLQCEITIAQLRSELNTKAQQDLRYEIEISGANEQPGENSTQLVNDLAARIGVSLDANDIDFITRVGPRNTQKSVDTGTKSPAPRPLVVRFVRRCIRDKFLAAGKAKKNLTTSDVCIPGPTRKLYINKRLTQENRRLFRAARLESRMANYKFCWVKHGTIYVRKQEGNPAVPIRTQNELLMVLGLPSQAS